MKSVSVARLASESGLSRQEATRIWRALELSGFRTWPPWALLAGSQLAYGWLSWLGAVKTYGEPVRFLQSVLMMGGVLGALWLSRWIAYPRMLDEARRRAQTEPSHRA